jgi:hypothetical protein
MKGIIKILEAIIASVILLTALTFFFTSEAPQQADDTRILIQVQDSLESLNKAGLLSQYVKNNNVLQFNSKLKQLFPASIDYSIEVYSMPPPEIYVGCNCTTADRLSLENLIEGTLEYKGRNVRIIVDDEQLNNIRPETNIIFFMNYRNLSEDMQYVNSFLDRGGGIILLSDLTKTQAEDPVLNSTFGLKWLGTPSSTPGTFLHNDFASNRTYNYYDNITPLMTDIPNKFSFMYFSASNGIGVDEKTAIVDSTGTHSFVKINYNLGQTKKGRSVWFANYAKINNDNKTIIINNLLKSTIMWSSGEHFKMDEFQKTLPEKYSKIHYIVAGDSVFEPFEVVIIVWRVFF